MSSAWFRSIFGTAGTTGRCGTGHRTVSVSHSEFPGVVRRREVRLSLKHPYKYHGRSTGEAAPGACRDVEREE
jgi:hypothetical protein